MSARAAAGLRRAALRALRGATPRVDTAGLCAPPSAPGPCGAHALARGLATRAPRKPPAAAAAEAAAEAPAAAAAAEQDAPLPDAEQQPPPPEWPPAASTNDLARVSADDVGTFVTFSEQDAARLLPEGCPALAAEFEHSGTRRLLVRDAFLRLRRATLGADPAAAPAAHAASLVLEGPAGAGKSVLLAQLVAAARSAGWLALYVPRGRALTCRSSFARHGDTPAWDTPEHARALLQSLDAAHGDALLATLKQRRAGAPAGAPPLRDLVAAGCAPAATPAAAVDACLAMLAELAALEEVPVLVAVDELNALYGWSEYHTVTGPKSRARLEAGALRVAAAVRAFDAPLARGARVGATSATAGVSPRVHLTGVPPRSRRAAPRLTQPEAGALLAHYAACGMAPGLAGAPLEAVVDASVTLHALTVGSGTALRRAAVIA